MKYRLSLLWKILLLFAEGIGLSLGAGLFYGSYNHRFPYMFTNLSNMAVFLYFSFAVVWLIRHGKHDVIFAPVVKHMVTMGVTVTFLIAHFFLFDRMFEGGYLHVGLLLLHYVAPIMAILDWLFFDPKGRVRIWEPPVWILEPVGYLLVAMVSVAGFGSSFGADVSLGENPYPYPFIDISQRGFAGVARFVAVACAAFVLLGYVVFAADHLLGKKESVKAQKI